MPLGCVRSFHDPATKNNREWDERAYRILSRLDLWDPADHSSNAELYYENSLATLPIVKEVWFN